MHIPYANSLNLHGFKTSIEIKRNKKKNSNQAS